LSCFYFRIEFDRAFFFLYTAFCLHQLHLTETFWNILCSNTVLSCQFDMILLLLQPHWIPFWGDPKWSDKTRKWIFSATLLWKK